MARSFLINTDNNLMFVSRNVFTLSYENEEFVLITNQGTMRFDTYLSFHQDRPILVSFDKNHYNTIGFYSSNRYRVQINNFSGYIDVSAKAHKDLHDFFEESKNRFLKKVIQLGLFERDNFSIFVNDDEMFINNNILNVKGPFKSEMPYLFNESGLFILSLRQNAFSSALDKYFIKFGYDTDVANFKLFVTRLQNKIYTK